MSGKSFSKGFSPLRTILRVSRMHSHSEEALNTGKLPLGVAILAHQIKKFDVLAWFRNCYITQVISLVV